MKNKTVNFLFTEPSIKVRQADTAEVFYNGQWHPICGHFFRANNHGARLFCQQLGYQSGIVTEESKSFGVRLPSDGIKIGRCKEGDIWPTCSDGCNDMGVGGTSCAWITLFALDYALVPKNFENS